jgi:hypothetical protein
LLTADEVTTAAEACTLLAADEIAPFCTAELIAAETPTLLPATLIAEETDPPATAALIAEDVTTAADVNAPALAVLMAALSMASTPSPVLPELI